MDLKHYKDFEYFPKQKLLFVNVLFGNNFHIYAPMNRFFFIFIWTCFYILNVILIVLLQRNIL